MRKLQNTSLKKALSELIRLTWASMNSTNSQSRTGLDPPTHSPVNAKSHLYRRLLKKRVPREPESKYTISFRRQIRDVHSLCRNLTSVASSVDPKPPVMPLVTVWSVPGGSVDAHLPQVLVVRMWFNKTTYSYSCRDY